MLPRSEHTVFHSLVVWVHVEFKHLDESDYKVLTWWCTHTQSELARVFIIELSLDHDRDSCSRGHLVGVLRESRLSRWSEHGLTGRKDLVGSLKHFHVERALQEVLDLGKYLGDRDVRRSRVALNGVQLVEIRELECHVVPVLLEGSFCHLSNVLDNLVCKDWKFDLKSIFLRLHGVAQAGEQELGADETCLFDHAHHDHLWRLSLLVAYR